MNVIKWSEKKNRPVALCESCSNVIWPLCKHCFTAQHWSEGLLVGWRHNLNPSQTTRLGLVKKTVALLKVSTLLMLQGLYGYGVNNNSHGLKTQLFTIKSKASLLSESPVFGDPSLPQHRFSCSISISLNLLFACVIITVATGDRNNLWEQTYSMYLFTLKPFSIMISNNCPQKLWHFATFQFTVLSLCLFLHLFHKTYGKYCSISISFIRRDNACYSKYLTLLMREGKRGRHSLG